MYNTKALGSWYASFSKAVAVLSFPCTLVQSVPSVTMPTYCTWLECPREVHYKFYQDSSVICPINDL